MAEKMTKTGCCWLGAVLLGVVVGVSVEPTAAAEVAYSPSATEALAETGLSGGVIVEVGVTDVELTLKLADSGRFLVQVLVPDFEKVERLRKEFSQRGVSGRISVLKWQGGRLPYAERLVDVVVLGKGNSVASGELQRVLRPNGWLFIQEKDRWKVQQSAGSDGTDQWTHFLHGPDNNAVSHDKQIGPPRRIQWLGLPKYARSHEHFASVSDLVTAGGRVFSIVDEGPKESVVLPSKWFLVARNAYNGVLLWKKRITKWENQLRPFRSGPPQIKRRLVADDQFVYVTLGYGEPVRKLDAATGKLVKTYEGTRNAEEIVLRDGVLYVVIGDPSATPSTDEVVYDPDKDKKVSLAKRRGKKTPPAHKKLLAVQADSGELLWKLDSPLTLDLLPLSLAVGPERVVFHNANELVCLNRTDGYVLWTVKRPVARVRFAWSVPTVVLYKDLVFVADWTPRDKSQQNLSGINWIISMYGEGNSGRLTAYSIKDGKELWSCPCSENYNAPVDVFIADGLVWVGQSSRRKGPDYTEGRDPWTGEVKRRLNTVRAFANTAMAHHRCYRDKATDRYILGSRSGVEYIGLEKGDIHRNLWVRGECQYGVMPANGFLYVPQDSCACFIEAKVPGLKAFSTATAQQLRLEPYLKTVTLEKGAAYQKAATGREADLKTEWPTFRHDPARSGFIPSTLPPQLRQTWKAEINGKPSPLTAAAGKLFVSNIESCTLVALDQKSGRPVWSFVAGSRVDSPPTYYNGCVYFGCADGWVYCLNAEDGQLCWRYRAAPTDRQVVIFNRLESAWPVKGSVLIVNDVLYCVAGRTSMVDGGMVLHRLDPRTGKRLSVTLLRNFDPETGEQIDRLYPFGIEAAVNGVLSSDGQNVFLIHHRFNLEGKELAERTVPHLFCPTDFLDDSWWHRTYWLYGTCYTAGWGGWWRAGNVVPAGRILSVDGTAVYGFGRKFYPAGNAGQWNKGEKYRLFAVAMDEANRLAELGNLILPRSKRRGRSNKGAAKRSKKGVSGSQKGAKRQSQKKKKQKKQPGRVPYNHSLVRPSWQVEPPYEGRALLVAGDTLFIAGPPSDAPWSLPSWEGRNGAKLLAYSKKDGKLLAQYDLPDLPVFAGMAVANGKLFVPLRNGQILCFQP